MMGEEAKEIPEDYSSSKNYSRLTLPAALKNNRKSSENSIGSMVTTGEGDVQRLKTPKDFIFGKILGEGSFSTVYAAKEVGTDNEFAIKVCEKALIKRERKVPYIHREKEVMKLLNSNPHSFFVRLYCTFQDDDRLYFVMTWAQNGELLDFMKKLGSFNEEVTRFYTAELILALEHLHKIGVIHRDLKPENILLSSDMHIKLSDFGSAKILSDDATIAQERPSPPLMSINRRNSFVGTAQYVSPEVLNGQICSPACDWWALGCIIYQMLSGLPPFRAANEYLIFQKITKLEYSFPDGFNSVAKNLVENLLINEPCTRLGSDSTGGVQALMVHPFLESIAWGDLPKMKPPDLKPYLPATADNEAFSSNYKIPDHLEPGLDDRQLTRLYGLELADVKPSTSGTSRKTSVVQRHILDITLEERRSRLAEQAKNNPYHRFVEGHLILKQGLIDKRKGLFARTRMFLLTEGPYLYYVDPANMEYKGQIPWSVDMRPEAKNFKTFFVHTPNRTYYLIDHTGHAPDWCEFIETVREFYFAKEKTPGITSETIAENQVQQEKSRKKSLIKI